MLVRIKVTELSNFKTIEDMFGNFLKLFENFVFIFLRLILEKLTETNKLRICILCWHATFQSTSITNK